MKRTRMKQGNKPTLVKNLLFSVAISIIILLVSAAVITAMVSMGNLDENTYQPVAMAMLAISTFTGVMVGSSMEQDKAMIVIAGAGAILYLVLVCINIALFDGVFSGIGWGTIMVLLGIASCIAVKTIRGNGRKKGSYKYRYR